MPLEAATFIADLNTSNPAGTDSRSAGDDHLRLIKSVLKATFPDLTTAIRFRVFSVESRAEALTTTIPVGTQILQTGGFDTPGDGGDALYYRVAAEPSHAGKLQSGDGAWWELIGELTPRKIGGFGDGVSHLISSRYASLSEAQAAFPKIQDEALAGKISPLTLADEIDWACIQECILTAKHLAPIQRVVVGDGIWLHNRQFSFLDFNEGIHFLGVEDSVNQQGSTRTGCVLRYNGNPGTPEAAIRITGTYHSFSNLNLENVGNATWAFQTGVVGVSGTGRFHLRNISIKPSTGVVEFSAGAILINAGVDYSIFERLEIEMSKPVLIAINNTGISTGGLTKFTVRDSVFRLTAGGTGVTVLTVTNAGAEIIEFVNNGITTKSDEVVNFIIINTDNIDADGSGGDLDVLIFANNEFDCLVEGTGSRALKLMKVRNAIVYGNYLSSTGFPAAMIDLTESDIHIWGNGVSSVNGPVINCRDANSKVFAGKNRLVNTAGLTDRAEANIFQPVWGPSIILTGETFDPGRVGVVKITATNTTSPAIGLRKPNDSPPGFWLNGQIVVFEVKNDSGGTMGTLSFSADYALMKAFKSPAAGETHTISFRWDGTNMREIGRTEAVPETGELLVQDRRSPGTGAGTTVLATWTPRVLNTVLANTVAGASLAANRITLPAGTYKVHAISPAGQTTVSHTCRLRNITAGTTLAVGTTATSGSSGGEAMVPSVLMGQFTLSATSALELQYYATVAGAQLGNSITSGELEVYAQVEIQKIG